VKLNLSRAAKKFKESEPRDTATPRPAASKKPATTPAPAKQREVAKQPEPLTQAAAETVEPATESTPAPAPEPKVKTKRARFVFVRPKTEKKEQPTEQPVEEAPSLPTPSKKQSAKLMTKNISLPPKEEQLPKFMR
jgi:hypothetical protein